MERVRPQPTVDSHGRRKSIFTEVGLVDESTVQRDRSPAPVLIPDLSTRPLPPARTVRFRSQNDILGQLEEHSDELDGGWESASDLDRGEFEALPNTPLQISPRTKPPSRMHQFGLLAIILALLVPVIQTGPITPLGARGNVIPRNSIDYKESSSFVKREDSKTDVCKRWAHQSTIVNGTLYIYGGNSITNPKQTEDTWNNDFLTLDLTKSWQISKPSLTGLPRPSGPPEVALGTLWNSLGSLYLYGGEFSHKPPRPPTAVSTWEYNLSSKQWFEHKNPKSSAGDKAPEDGQPIQRSAEGSGFGVSTLGRGWYFGGHLDMWTTEGWNTQIDRVYLKSMVEFTFPGHSNNAVESLRDGKTASEGGVWRNVTDGSEGSAGFPERADGVLVYVPGFGEQGLLLGLGGGTNDTFTQMNIIDVFDIATSSWYKQTTSGKVPKFRVNPCAVVGAAADGSSYNIHMFGGQSLQPAGDQTQYDDMWILSVPSFTWIEVDMSKQGVPPARAGHTCHVWDGQMIVVGGYVPKELSCDSPGIYVFNMSSLSWSDQFTALTGDRALQAWEGKEDSQGNPLGQQANQRGFDSKAGLEGSYAYAVPSPVQQVIGGKETGGATLTAPVQTPTEGPFKSGTPITYTVTGADGAIITETAAAGAAGGGKGGPNIGAIVAGVVAGIFAIVAAYFAFCAWIYRKQVAVWKNHAAMVTQRSETEKRNPFVAGVTATTSSKVSSERPPIPGSADGVRMSGEASQTGYAGAAGMDPLGRRSSEGSVTDDLLAGSEPSFWGTRGVLLNPRRSLRVINKD
ncbi:kelch repeat protein-like protein [Massariosphaeria phaeospora]|uniref:Kelch repeat protein-like protein n=1 Tax=Massariosphaeria phaeospora TaxID=100035 RepID=A0A7C8ID26_9PLEO|nr:kelch repeat protein-like protein [Massariosphaeria phaeospora]